MMLYMEDKIFNLLIIFKGKTIFLKSIENTHQGLNRYGMRNIIMNEMLVGSVPIFHHCVLHCYLKLYSINSNGRINYL